MIIDKLMTFCAVAAVMCACAAGTVMLLVWIVEGILKVVT